MAAEPYDVDFSHLKKILSLTMRSSCPNVKELSLFSGRGARNDRSSITKADRPLRRIDSVFINYLKKFWQHLYDTPTGLSVFAIGRALLDLSDVS